MKARLKLLPEADREKVLARRKRFLEATDAATAEKKKISLRSVKASSPAAAAAADRRDEADQREEERERRRERRREERKREDDKERKVAAVAKDGDARRKISQKKGE